MAYAIVTRILPCINTRGTRVQASAPGYKRPGLSRSPTVTLPYEHGLNNYSNHQAAAYELARTLGWAGRWVAACTDPGWVFVRDDGDREYTFDLHPVECHHK